MRYKIKKIIVWIGIVLVAFIAVGLVIRAVFNYTNGKKLEKFLSQMKSEGIPLTIKDIEPECSPRDNAAIDWKTAEAILSIDRENRTLLGQVIDDLFYGRPLSEEKKDKLRGLIKENQDALQFILKASTKPRFKYVEKWERPGYDLIKISTAINMIQSTRLLGIDAVIKAEDGDVEKAIDQCLAARRFLQSYLQEPFLISYLVGMACIKQVAVCLDHIVSDREIETEILREILDEWDSYPWKEGLLWALKSERTLGLETALLYLRGEHDLDVGRGGGFFYWWFRPIYKSEIIWMTGQYDRLLKEAQMPYYSLGDSEELEQRMNSAPWYYKMAGVLVPNAVTVMFKRATLDAMFETARIGMACKIYKNLHGDFPEDLADLAPEIIEKIPVDPFTGDPFIYKKQDSSFIVYSIGSNLKDDGGRGTWRITSLVMEKDDDWAWKEVTARR